MKISAFIAAILFPFISQAAIIIQPGQYVDIDPAQGRTRVQCEGTTTSTSQESHFCYCTPSGTGSGPVAHFYLMRVSTSAGIKHETRLDYLWDRDTCYRTMNLHQACH